MGKRDPVFGNGDGFDRPGLGRAGGTADVQLGLGSEVRRTRIAGERCPLRWDLDLTIELLFLAAGDLLDLALQLGTERRDVRRATGQERIEARSIQFSTRVGG